MTAQTTGQDVLDRVSEAEATCLRSSIGDEAYEEFLGGEVLTSYGKVGDQDREHPDAVVAFLGIETPPG